MDKLAVILALVIVDIILLITSYQKKSVEPIKKIMKAIPAKYLIKNIAANPTAPYYVFTVDGKIPKDSDFSKVRISIYYLNLMPQPPHSDFAATLDQQEFDIDAANIDNNTITINTPGASISPTTISFVGHGELLLY